VRTLVPVVTVCCFVATSAYAQSLGEAARKEAQRRTRNGEEGVRARSYGEADVRSDPGEAGGQATTPDPSPAPREPVAASGTARDLEREQARRQNQQEFWRGQMGQARARVASAERLCATDPLVLGGG
jgi:hypothetical protein